jgi:hypothetical protein
MTCYIRDVSLCGSDAYLLFEADTHWMRDLVDPQDGLDDMEKWKFCILSGIELWTLDLPACSQSLYRLSYPDCLMPNHVMKLFPCCFYPLFIALYRYGQCWCFRGSGAHIFRIQFNVLGTCSYVCRLLESYILWDKLPCNPLKIMFRTTLSLPSSGSKNNQSKKPEWNKTYVAFQ